MKKIVFLLLLISPLARADLKQVQDQVAIQRVLTTIPYIGSEIDGTDMPYKTVAQRLPKLGLAVNLMSIASLEKEDYKNTKGVYKKGDITYTFNTNEPNINVKAICPISNSFSFVKRGKTWLADDRTAAFISTYHCQAPDRAK